MIQESTVFILRRQPSGSMGARIRSLLLWAKRGLLARPSNFQKVLAEVTGEVVASKAVRSQQRREKPHTCQIGVALGERLWG